MKCVIKKNNPPNPHKLKYPVLMQHRLEKETVVLFFSPTQGYDVANNSLGDDWVPATDLTSWEVFNGTVELKN